MMEGNNKKHLLGSYLIVLVLAIALYVISCAPGVVWQDSGLYQYRIWHNDIEGKLGLATSHPLYHILAIAVKYIPYGEFGYRVNLLTAVISAVAVANVFLLLRLWLKKALPALVGALTLGLSHTFWRHAAIPETYNLAAALLLCELIMLLQYTKTGKVGYLYLLGLINGLAIANHMLASIAFACYLVLIAVLAAKKRIRGRELAVIILLWIIGALPYEYLIVKNILQSGDLAGTLASAAFGTRWKGEVLNTSLTGKIIKDNFMWIALNYPTPNILLSFVGLYYLHKISIKRWFGSVLLALLILYFAFAFRYTIVDQYAFFIPSYCIISILVGLGTHKAAKGKIIAFAIVTFSLLTVPVYVAAPKVAKELGISRRRELPYRDDYRYFLQPWRTGYRGAERFASEALDTAERNAIIFADSTTFPPLLYVQDVKAKRRDIKIISHIYTSENPPEFNERSIEKLLAERAVYVVSPTEGYCPDFLLKRYSFKPAGVIWRVVEKQTK